MYFSLMVLTLKNIVLKKTQKDLMTKMKELEVQLGMLNKTNQELNSQMQNVQTPQGVGAGVAKAQSPQMKAAFINPQIPNEVQRVQVFAQNGISLQQGAQPTQALAQNPQVIATTQIPGLNFFQNYQ